MVSSTTSPTLEATRTDEPMEVVRRSSTSSESSERRCEGEAKASENPLMRLVDAALSPNSRLNAAALTDVSTMDESVEAAVSTKTRSETNSTGPARPAGVVTEAQAMPSAASSEETSLPLPPLQEGNLNDKVIRGTVQDLVARQEKVSFAEYLMLCLGDESNHDVLQWMPCGTQFTITNHRKFTMERMPVLFKIRNMSSFVRKLTRWGFSRVHEKETGNSDIFKHEYFLRDQPDLCKKIRCVNRSATASVAAAAVNKPMGHGIPLLPVHPHYQHHHNEMMTTNHSRHRSSDSLNHSHRVKLDEDHNLPMISPRRSMGHAMSFHHGRSPHANSASYSSSSRYHHFSPSGQYMNHTSPSRRMHGAPRVSPEYEREMLGPNHYHMSNSGSNHASSFRPGPPQVYSPPTMGRTLSVAAEYELEQVLLERQRARLYREQQRLTQQQAEVEAASVSASSASQSPHSGPSPPLPPQPTTTTAVPPPAHYQANSNSNNGNANTVPCPSTPRMGSGSERSSSLDLSDRRYSMIGGSADLDFLGGSNNSMSSALESLEREVGEYDLDMSPREAMLRAVLHKRQQQRAQKRASATQSSGSGGGGILKHSSSYFDPAEGPPPSTARHSSYYR